MTEIQNITPKFVAEKTSKAGKKYWAVSIKESTDGFYTHEENVARALRDNVNKAATVECDGNKIVSLNATPIRTADEMHEFHLSPEECRARALEAALSVHKLPSDDVKEIENFWTTVHQFADYINGTKQ